jgi:2-methylcitrate dehydratase PrpD
MMKEPKLYKLTENIGNGKFKIDDNSFKPYACCKHTHAANFAVKVFAERKTSPRRMLKK